MTSPAQVGRRSKFDIGPKKQYTDEAIAAEMGMSTAKLNRLMKLSEATKQICDLVDDNTIPLSVAYNIAFLTPKVQDTVADLIGINVKVNNENTQLLKKVAEKESLTEKKIRDVLEGNYPPKVVEKPKPVTPPVQAALQCSQVSRHFYARRTAEQQCCAVPVCLRSARSAGTERLTCSPSTDRPCRTRCRRSRKERRGRAGSGKRL